MGPKITPRKIESKRPDIKLPPNINNSKLGVESKQVVSCIITYFTEMFEKKDREIKELLANVSMLETRVVKLEQQIDENSAHERKNTLIMAGTIPHAPQAVDCKFIEREQILEHLGLEFAIEDISMGHRIGVKPKIQGEDKHNIMFKLCNRDEKRNILKSCKVVKPKKFYITETSPHYEIQSYMQCDRLKRNIRA